MLEVDDLDVVGRAQDYCLDRGAIRVMLGKHVNDHMVSFYCLSPSGLTIEYGWGGREIDDGTHQVGHYESAHFWGHRPPDGRNIEAAMRKAMEQARGDAVLSTAGSGRREGCCFAQADDGRRAGSGSSGLALRR